MAKDCNILGTLIFDFPSPCILRVQCDLTDDNGFGTYEFLLYETVMENRNGGILIKDKMTEFHVKSNLLATYLLDIIDAKIQRDECVERLLNAVI